MGSEEPQPSLRLKHIQQLTKTEMCKFFLQYRCGKGPNCPFAHSYSEIRSKPNLFKTSMCKTFLTSGTCDRPGCTYAHDERELRTTHGFYKSKMCRFAPSGRCKHGAACRFAHSIHELSGDPEVDQATFNQSDAASASDQATGTMAPSPTGRTTEQWADVTSDQSNRDIASDQSTRADTNASVPTPEGSGDSGQEETSRGSGEGQRRGGGGPQVRTLRSGGERAPARHFTTLMLTNVPTFLTQGALVSLIEDLTVCARGAFDFFYCPWDPYQDQNLGYAIINFFSRSVAAEFERIWGNQPLFPGMGNSKRLKIVPAALQGRAANLRHFSGFTLAHHEDLRFRPLVRTAPGEPLSPMSTPQELAQAAYAAMPLNGASETTAAPPPSLSQQPTPPQTQQAPSGGGRGNRRAAASGGKTSSHHQFQELRPQQQLRQQQPSQQQQHQQHEEHLQGLQQLQQRLFDQQAMMQERPMDHPPIPIQQVQQVLAQWQPPRSSQGRAQSSDEAMRMQLQLLTRGMESLAFQGLSPPADVPLPSRTNNGDGNGQTMSHSTSRSTAATSAGFAGCGGSGMPPTCLMDPLGNAQLGGEAFALQQQTHWAPLYQVGALESRKDSYAASYIGLHLSSPPPSAHVAHVP